MLPIVNRVADSALVVAVGGSILYFLGLTYAQGQSAAVELPDGFLRNDIHGTLAQGADGLFVAIMTPVTIWASESRQFPSLLTFVLMTIAILAMIRARAPFPVKFATIAVVAFVGTNLLVFFQIHNQSLQRVRSGYKCILSPDCNHISRVVSRGVEDKQAVVIYGRVYYLGDRFLIIVTKEGARAIPTATVIHVDALRHRPAELAPSS